MLTLLWSTPCRPIPLYTTFEEVRLAAVLFEESLKEEEARSRS
jgi:hypothetical protein